MIAARTAFDALAARLADRAGRIAAAHAARRLLAARGDERRWRRPGLVWPLFGKDT